MAAQAIELYGCNCCLVELDVVEDVSHVGAVEEIVQEARSLVIVEMLIVAKRRNAQSISQSPSIA